MVPKDSAFFLSLDWDTINIKTPFSKDENGIKKVTSITAWPDNPEADNPENSEAAFRLDQSTNTAHSFLYRKNMWKEPTPN
ncbi:MAG: hypothetical protein HZB99_02975 [Candidatus Harrisonbacteria bacterium]|nr:hypothetical protein [Candidatus Harrisonbacteria bacterium]